MKITRLKKGVCIRLSDTEFQVLCSVFTEGVEGLVIAQNMDSFSKAEKIAYTRRVNTVYRQGSFGDFLHVDEDKR